MDRAWGGDVMGSTGDGQFSSYRLTLQVKRYDAGFGMSTDHEIPVLPCLNNIHYCGLHIYLQKRVCRDRILNLYTCHHT